MDAAHKTPPSSLDLYTLTLRRGLPATTQSGKPIHYRQVHLRDTTVGDERWAVQQAERLVPLGGTHKLVVSEETFKHALTVRHIAAFECDGARIGQELIDMALVDKLDSHDFGLIEARVFLLTLAAEVRNGLMSQADFDAIVAGTSTKGKEAPQPVGQAAEFGDAPARAQPGPVMLADFTGDPAHSAPAGHGGGAAEDEAQALAPHTEAARHA